ncbi:substrate-binding domain-containing protein [Limnochorda pilosa]|uniref:XRE family transcriptional regulator n=1 Tax=Limnochorda pilosa TaxID=1555112 RepID=A0A0K2SKH2_LIMPI|nr:substrate-binding domain-containing protein [Limnochorda pilosa]BAS27339.1 XRE family transcriptional regulator [Limnochorda pilosa]
MKRAERVASRLRAFREARGLTQEQLARLSGLTRQTVSAVEQERASVSAASALRLARALGCTVEELFALEAPVGVTARWAGAEAHLVPGQRIFVVQQAEGFVALPLEREIWSLPADGRVDAVARDGTVAVDLWRRPAGEGARAILAGCDPALPLLGQSVTAQGRGFGVAWRNATSGQALRLLAQGLVAVAGVHLLEEESGEYNLPFVRAALSGQAVRLVHLAYVHEGLAVTPGNPLGIRGPEDLARPGVRFVNRPRGSGARALLDRELRRAGIPASAVLEYERELPGHLDVARAVALGLADACVTTESAAVLLGLAFVPLARERYDLAVAGSCLEWPVVRALLDVLHETAFRRELAALGPYEVGETGRELARLEAA